MCECNSMLPEAFWHDNMVTPGEKLAKDPLFFCQSFRTVCPISDSSFLRQQLDKPTVMWDLLQMLAQLVGV